MLAGLFRRRDKTTRGALMVEYAFLLLAVFIPMSVGAVAGGKHMLDDYRISRGWVLQNTP